ncbi:MAG: hypothetical protein M3123_06935 [Actinomycetota bacterium]|nr:hypothetical protein [Actinomycetota bacterium]
MVSAASVAGVTLAVLEAVVALVAGGQPLLSAAVLLLAPGLVAAPFLPAELRSPGVRVAVVPLVGAALSAIAVITVSAVAPLTGTSVRAVLLALVAVAFVASLRPRSRPLVSPAETREDLSSEAAVLVLLGAALALGITLQAFVLGARPIPGQDWGHYLVYADEIRRQHALLIDNPYWMLGLPFAHDPGAPSLYGGYLLLSGDETAVLARGIWVFAVLAILAVFVFVAVLWGTSAGVLAAGFYAAIPMNLDMLSWHGAANTYALTLLPLVLLAAGMALRGRVDVHWSAFLAVALVALAAAHRLTFLLALLALVPAFVIASRRRLAATARYLAATAVVALVAGAGVLADLVRRGARIGDLQDYRAYEGRKLAWEFVIRDLTPGVALLAVLGLVALLVARPLRGDRSGFVLVALLAAILAIAYAWLVHIPIDYTRAAYYLPLLAAALIAVAWTTLLPRVLLVAAVVVIALVAAEARDLARDFRDFYGSANRASLRGLDYVKARSDGDDVVVTDACWGFLASWFLQRPILAALQPAQILPEAEVAPARTARRILYSGDRRLAAKVDARYAVVDPKCTNVRGEPVEPPVVGRPVFASTRLVVLDLGRSPRPSRAPSRSG